jgi:SAM-dependent methyltransferase
VLRQAAGSRANGDSKSAAIREVPVVKGQVNEKTVQGRLAKYLQRDWNRRARENAFFYIASWNKEWDEESFFASGEQDYLALVEPVLTQAGFTPEGKTLLEVGCGAGRMTQSFARRFARVYAFDVSKEMLERARQYQAGFFNICWTLGDGATLTGVEDGCCDFVFSYLVLQHLPTQALVLGMVREILRVLQPGGMFLFQFNGATQPTMNWRGRAAWGFVDALWTLGLERASGGAAALFGLDPAMAGKSWRGARVDAAAISTILQLSGAEKVRLTGERTPMAWCSGIKAAGIPS